MLDQAPHRLQSRFLSDGLKDEFGRQVTESSESWDDVAECFCHDNSQMKQVSVNGELWTYQYHVVYEGVKIGLGTKVRCLGPDGNVVGEGKVIKNAECYSEGLEGRCDLWLG